MPYIASAIPSAVAFRAAYEKGVKSLLSRQDASGAWLIRTPSGDHIPSMSLTLLSVIALIDVSWKDAYREELERAISWVVSRQCSDGSFGDGHDSTLYKSYNTSFALTALSSADRERHDDVIRRAMAFLRSMQRHSGLYRGGIGYGTIVPFPTADNPAGTRENLYAALAPTSFAAQGAHRARLPLEDPFWSLLIEFCRSVHNSRSINRSEETLAFLHKHGFTLGDDGGLFSTPFVFSSASAAGPPSAMPRAIIGSGGITYLGLRAYLDAGVPKDSPEVQSAMHWIRSHYSVSTHAGFAEIMAAGQKPLRLDEPKEAAENPELTGLYYYYHAMADALHRYGEHPLMTADGNARDWALDVAACLYERQNPDGSWSNPNPRWLEFDSVLSSAFALMACNVVFPYLSPRARWEERDATLADVASEIWLETFLSKHGGTSGTVHLLQGDVLRLVNAVNIPPPVVKVTEAIAKGKGMAGLAWERDQVVATCNLKTDTSGDVRPGARAVNAQAALAIPVRSRGGSLRAVVGIAFKNERDFSAQELAAFEAEAASLPVDA